jgi:hypothetical protein
LDTYELPPNTGYVLTRVVRGAGVLFGTTYELRWLVDAEGNVVEFEWCELFGKSFDDWFEDYGPHATVDEWRRYVSYAASSGHDPLDFLAIPHAADGVASCYEVLIAESDPMERLTGLIVLAARKEGHWRWIELRELPELVSLALVGSGLGACSLLGTENIELLQILSRNTETNPGFVVPGSLIEHGQGVWSFVRIVEREPHPLRVMNAASDWLATHPER